MALISLCYNFSPVNVKILVLPSGYLQSLFGVYSLRIENAGVRRPPSDDVQIQGVANPSDFRKVLCYQRSCITGYVIKKV